MPLNGVPDLTLVDALASFISPLSSGYYCRIGYGASLPAKHSLPFEPPPGLPGRRPELSSKLLVVEDDETMGQH